MAPERALVNTDLGDRFRLFSGRSSPELALEVASVLGRDLCEVRFQTFYEGEVHIQIEQSVRGVDAYVIQPTCQPVNDTLVELLVLIDALRRASAATITAVIPYFGYARQDHKSTGREPITAKLVANLLTTAGADRIVSIDLHSPRSRGSSTSRSIISPRSPRCAATCATASTSATAWWWPPTWAAPRWPTSTR